MGTEQSGTRYGLSFDLGAFDLDGTVLRRNLRITSETTTALERLRDRGMRLVVATGRRFEDASEYAERLGFAEGDRWSATAAPWCGGSTARRCCTARCPES